MAGPSPSTEGVPCSLLRFASQPEHLLPDVHTSSVRFRSRDESLCRPGQEAKSALTFTDAVYPNDCWDIPPAEGF
jgi:hypothetical protein